MKHTIETILYDVLREAEARTKPFPTVRAGCLTHRETWVMDEATRRIVEAVEASEKKKAEDYL